MKRLSLILIITLITVFLCSCSEKVQNSSVDASEISHAEETTTTQTLKPAESLPEQSKADENVLYGYTPMGYIDDEMNYLLLYKCKSMDCKYVIYDGQKKCLSDPINVVSVIPTASYGDGIFTLFGYELSEDGKEVTDTYAVSYNEKCEEVGRISNLPLTADKDIAVRSVAYHKASDRYVVCYEDSQSGEHVISFFDKNGEETEQIAKGKEYCAVEMYTEDDRIIIHKQKHHPTEDTLQVLDLKGNTLYEKTIGNEYNAIRTERAGKYIYMIPSQRTDFRHSPLPTGEVAFYDTEKDELFIFKPKTVKEAALIRFTPNGRYAVAVNVEDITEENQTQYLGSINTVRIYDIATGEVVKEFTEEKLFWFEPLIVYDDGFIVKNADDVRYEYKFG
ncbi:MAG: hypothetical protein J6D27_03275 [Ruminiclostridium sp.]|nr:hypothetical protein [Ruminiclostridium sp.]